MPSPRIGAVAVSLHCLCSKGARCCKPTSPPSPCRRKSLPGSQALLEHTLQQETENEEAKLYRVLHESPAGINMAEKSEYVPGYGVKDGGRGGAQ